MMQNLILVSLLLCSAMDCLRAEFVYAAVSGLPASFLPPPPSPSGNILHQLRPVPTQDANQIRSQRSLYGPPLQGWQGPPVQPHTFGLGHISKQELITLLEAAKEVAAKPQGESEPEQGPGAETGSAPAGPPAGAPLTVSLPAFVPIQLSAMYTAPRPGAPPEAPSPAAAPEEQDEEEADQEESSEEEDDDEEEEEEEEEDEEAEPERESAPAIIKPYPPIYHPWSSRVAFSQRVVPFASNSGKKSQVRSKSAKTKSKSRSKSKSKSGKSKSKKSKSKSSSKKRTNRKPLGSASPNLRYGGSAQEVQVLPPPPPFLARPPGPLKLVPSSQLLSNWK